MTLSASYGSSCRELLLLLLLLEVVLRAVVIVAKITHEPTDGRQGCHLAIVRIV